jgi:hypothetical protein
LIHGKENAFMSHIRRCLMAIALVAAASTGAIAQAPASKPSTAEQVETWSRKQWDAAKKEWAKDKTKWADCRKQSSDQKLKGRKSWSFVYTCMTS